MGVSEARGVVTLCLAQHNIPLGEYKPNQIKQAVTGTAAADKELVEKYVKILLGLKTEPKPDHAADALAGAITHLHFGQPVFLFGKDSVADFYDVVAHGDDFRVVCREHERGAELLAEFFHEVEYLISVL